MQALHVVYGQFMLQLNTDLAIWCIAASIRFLNCSLELIDDE